MLQTITNQKDLLLVARCFDPDRVFLWAFEKDSATVGPLTLFCKVIFTYKTDCLISVWVIANCKQNLSEEYKSELAVDYAVEIDRLWFGSVLVGLESIVENRLRL